MRLLGMAVGLAGVCAAALVALSARDASVGTVDLPAAVAPVEPEAPARRTLRPVPSRVRPVAPDRVAIPPVEQQALLRVEEREPLSPIGRATDPSQGPPRPAVLHRPLAVAAGLFEAQGHSVALAGIEPLDADEECVSDGVSWPCGVHARTAFRNWLRGRALTCTVPPVPGDEVVVSACTVGRHDPAEWLVAQGWVRALPDGPYAEAAAQAQEQRRGIFGPTPAQSAPAPLALPELSGD